MPLLAMRTAIVGADASLCLLTAIGLFFAPHIAADLIFKGASDGIHWHLLRCVGGQLMAASFMLFCIHKGASEVRSSCYLVRIIGMSLTLLLLNHALSMSSDLISIKFLIYTTFFGFLFLMVFPLMFTVVGLNEFWCDSMSSDYYVTTIKYWCYMAIAVYGSMQTLSGWPVGNSLSKTNKMGNFLYQLDSIASIVIGGAFFAFPKWLLYRQVKIELNETHEFCGRLLGAFFMSSYIVSSHALHWESNVHRQVAVDSRSIVCVIILLAQIWSQYAYGAYWSGGHWVGISLYSTWTIICLIYRYSLRKTNNVKGLKKLQ